MERQEFAADYGQLRHTALPIELGGTFGRTPEEALINLGVASASALGGNGGVAKLAASGYIDLTTIPDDMQYLPTVYGDDTVLVGSTNEYRITNYDLNTPYTVTADHGTAVVEGDVVRFTAPATPASSGFTLNNEHTTVDVVYPSPLKPTIVAPVDLAQNQAFSGLLIKSSAFKMLGGSDIHEMSDWELSRVSNFATIEQSSYADGINLTTWSPGDLWSQTEYYVRARHKSVEHGWSPWGPAIKFKTKTDGVTGNIVGEGTWAPNTGARYGARAAISGDGNVLAFSAPADSTYGGNKGAGYVVRKVANGWNAIRLDNLYEGLLGSYSVFGNGEIDINYDGSKIIFGCTAGGGIKAVDQRNGRGGLYDWDGTKYVKKQITPQQYSTNLTVFGTGAAMSGDGTMFFMGAPHHNSGRNGYVQVMYPSGASWGVKQIIEVAGTLYLGSSISVSHDASVMIAACLRSQRWDANFNWSPGYAQNTLYMADGSVIVFRKQANGTYAQETTLYSPVGANGFGWKVKVSADGNTIAVCSGGAYTDTTNDRKGVSVWTKSATGWTFVQHITLPNGFLASSFTGFAHDVDINADGTKMAIGCPRTGSPAPGDALTGCVFMFKKVNGTWTYQKAIFLPGTPKAMSFGFQVGLSDDGNRLLASALSYNANQGYGYVLE